MQPNGNLASSGVPGLRRALARARAGKSIDPAEAVTLLSARGAELEQLCAVAAAVRDAGLADAGRPGVITYSRKVFIPLTRLCRDRCHYCTFATTPARVPAAFLSPDEVVAIARRGAELGCKEALFTLGDRPEERWSDARDWLHAHGYDDTLAYVRAMAIRVLEETGLLPHLNPGVMSWEELQRLKPVAASMGLMLETTATRLWSEPGGCHFGSPDKEPAVRLRVLDDASRSAIPFTTGILVGIGETPAERADALFRIRHSARQFSAIQEVIVQNFRAKPGTAMQGAPDLDPDEYLAVIAVARLIMGPRMRIQAPPNLSEPAALARLLAAGVDDWGGVSPLTPDHVNPERPWPHLAELARLTAAAGFELRERLALQPEYLSRAGSWIDPRIAPHVHALADASGLAADVRPSGLAWQEPDSAWSSSGRVDLHAAIDAEGRTGDRRGDFEVVYGDWDALRERLAEQRRVAPPRLDSEAAAALRAAERDPGGLTDEHALTLAHADGTELDALCRLADAIRQDAVGDTVTYVVNRNINFTNVCYVGCRFCAFAQRRSDVDAYTLSIEEVGARAEEAWAAGAGEVCMQGGIHPDLPGTAYFDLAAEIRRRTPAMHVHAFSPMEIVNGAARTGMPIRDFLIAVRDAGVDTVPGTAAEILDDEVRWILTKGKLPADLWVTVITTAHEVGLRSSSTMMYGHVDEPRHWVGHLRVLADIQDRTGGFTEFVPLPFVHHNAPVYLAGVARPGPTARENRAVHALARVMLHGRIENIQCSWVKLGVDGCRELLQGGANDLGGTLMEETISRMAGSQFGSLKTIAELEQIATGIGRPARQRTTTYGTVPAERLEAARHFDESVRIHPPIAASLTR